MKVLYTFIKVLTDWIQRHSNSRNVRLNVWSVVQVGSS